MEGAGKINVSAYRAGDVTIDLSDFRVQKNGQQQKVTPRAFKVLVYLIENRGRVVEKQELFERIWGESFVTDNALTRIVKEIRQAIGDDASRPRYIETVPKRGYRFIAEVAEIENEKETTSPPQPPPAPPTEQIINRADENKLNPPERENLRAAPYAVKTDRPKSRLIIVPVLILALLSIWFFYRGRPSNNAPPSVLRTVQVTNWPGLDNYPAISPDGNSIAYSSDHNGSFEIYVKPLAPGAREIQVTSDGAQNFQPSWSPDGQQIAFYSKTRGGIWVVPASGGATKQLTDFGSRPVWSPDGKYIAFQVKRGDDTHIAVMPREGGHDSHEQITSESGQSWINSFAPDGDKIAFAGLRDYIWNIYWISRTTKEQKQLTGNNKLNAYVRYPSWSPLGTQIAYEYAETTGNIWLTELK